MYTIINTENLEVIRSFEKKADAEWMAYSLERRGHRVEILQPPELCYRAMVEDIDFIDLTECLGV